MEHILNDIRVVISLISAGGPSAPNEQRLAQVKLHNINKFLKKQAQLPDKLSELEKEIQTLNQQLQKQVKTNEELQEKYDILSAELKATTKELRTEKARVTRLTKKLTNK